MSAKIIDGKAIAAEVEKRVSSGVEELKVSCGVTPGLGVILVGDNPASHIYVKNKAKKSSEVRIRSQVINIPADSSQDQVIDHIEKLNVDENIHGILVQSPLPEHLDEDYLMSLIHPKKDVDGFHPVNVGLLVMGNPRFVPATPSGVMEMLRHEGVDPSGRHAVVVGRSKIVGKPMVNLLVQKAEGANATVTVCHTGTKDLGYHTRQADILIVAAGRPRMIAADMVSEGTVVIDVGINSVKDPSRKSGYRLVGDVNFESVKDKASAISPVPGGVGPMTIAMLLSNTLKAAQMACEPQ